jgi:hypothetical protein
MKKNRGDEPIWVIWLFVSMFESFAIFVFGILAAQATG